VGSKGYVLGGFDGNYLKDLWEYNPSSDTWAQRASLPGNKRFNASVFVINSIVYVVGGNNNGTYVKDFWAYDSSTDTWTKKRDISNTNDDEDYDDDYTSIVRQNAAAFVINNLGYLATGDVSSLLSTVWEYDPATDLWTEKTNFEGTARTNAVGITVQNRGFILTGKTSSLYLDDVWEFLPFAEYDEND
jgi:N-acetylneuraminic acid mutarotase